MKLKVISDKKEAKYIFMIGLLTKDKNRLNYSKEQFELAWNLWLKFYVLYDDKDNVISFCGIRKYDGGYGRIFDRYFCMPEYRIKYFNKSGTRFTSNKNESLYYLKFVKKMVQDCREAGLIPFFSIQLDTRKNIIKLGVEHINKLLSQEDKFKVLDGLYCTVPGYYDDKSNWQNIAITYPYKTLLKRKENG